MAFGVSMNVEGSEALRKTLRALDEKVSKRIIGAALKKAGKPIEQGAAANVRGISPTIADSMTSQARTYKKVVKILKVGPGSGHGVWKLKRQENPITGKISPRFHKPEFTSHLVELGTQPHQIRLPGLKITINHPGTPAKPFLQPALEEYDQLAITIFQTVAWKGIEREARRQARAAAK